MFPVSAAFLPLVPVLIPRVALVALLGVGLCSAQVITIDTHGGATSSGGTVDRRYTQIEPTNVPLTKSTLDEKNRLELIRLLQAEQGFAMRPFPRGHKGLTLQANGKLEPAGEAYLDMVTANGLCAKPGDRIVITDIKIEHEKIILLLNGGPDARHRFLRHIQLGTGPMTSPVVQDDPNDVAQGARLTLTFKEHIPELTDKDVKALLSPLISFDVKTPIQAFTDTLPPKLKDAILNHHVMVGMTTDMVMFALGQPDQKIREMDGQTPFEEWVYGKPPKPVQFVRINGNRVIRLEIAKVGEPPLIFTIDEVEGLMRTDGTPLAPENGPRTVAMGDTHRNPDTQSPDPSPSLRRQGETLPQDDPHSQTQGAMKPVQFPEQKPDDYPDASNLPRTPQPDDPDAKPDAKPDSKPDSDKKPDQQPSQPPPQPSDKPAQQPTANPPS
jgi:hypothetical protein